MQLTFLPTLKHATLTTIASSLWNQNRIRNLLLSFEIKPLLVLNEDTKKWEKLENIMFESILSLPIPKKLKKELSTFVRPIGLQILAWMNFHFIHLKLQKVFPSTFIWKSHGVLDKENTARLLIEEKRLNDYDSYKLSCVYCLEEYINPLWEKLQKSADKKKLKNKEESHVKDMMIYWSNCTKKNFIKKMIQSIQSTDNESDKELSSSITCGNEPAVKYLIKNLDRNEKKKLLISLAKKIIENRFDSIPLDAINPCKDQFTNILHFLLSEMDEEDRAHILESQGYWILQCFLDWPYQNILLENAKQFWVLNSTDPQDFDRLLLRCVDKILKGYQDYDYYELFKSIWEGSPYICKKEIVNTYIYDCAKPFLRDFFAFIKTEIIDLILKDESLIDRERYFTCEKYRDKFCWHTNEIGIFQFFTFGCLFPEDVMIKYKEDYKDRIGQCYQIKDRDDTEEEEVWYEFFEVLDEFFNVEKNERWDDFTRTRYKIKCSGKYMNGQAFRL